MFSNSQSTRAWIVGSVMASMAMVAIEATIISTAMPQIVADLGGLHLYSWVFAAFLLTQTAFTVVFGNLADVYGRKPIMLISIAIFTIASILAGFAWSMPSMILFRLLQGVGAGGMQPVAMTIIADRYPARERGKVQGYLASVWAVAAVLGPVVGGVIVRNASWPWVFWINVPVGCIAAAGFIAFLREGDEHQSRSIDITGAVTFTIAVASLLFALSELGTAVTTPAIAGGVCLLSSLAFVLQERRAADPMISFRLWTRRPLATANGVALLAAMALMGLTTFVPIFVQVVLRRSPVVAGLALTTMLLGWPAGATLAARLFDRYGLHRLLLMGTMLLPIGAAIFPCLTPLSSPVTAALGSLIMGFGMGLLSVSALVLVQEVVDRTQRGSATASNLFSRNLGSTLGATVLGAVFSHGITRATNGAPISSEQLRGLMSMRPGSLPGDADLSFALQHSLKLTFLTMLGMAVVTVVIAIMVPSVELKKSTVADPVAKALS